MKLLQVYTDKIIREALLEDINYLDLATDYLIDENKVSTAVFTAKKDGVVCGIEIAARVFELLDKNSTAKILVNDGQKVTAGQKIAEFTASAAALLKGERTALNLIGHMSGIATATALITDRLKNTPEVSVCETRKTHPGLRALEKYAVLCGGGKNHRFNLSDAAMIKDTHIDVCGSVYKAVTELKKRAGHMVKVEIEVGNFEQLEEAFSAGADVIMLDHFSTEDMKKAVEMNAKRNIPAILEASGNITKENIEKVAAAGVDVISLGAITYAAGVLDISMRIL